jgi:hypothetical protein
VTISYLVLVHYPSLFQADHARIKIYVSIEMPFSVNLVVISFCPP